MEEARKVRCSALWLVLENSICDNVTSLTEAVGKRLVGFPGPVSKPGSQLSLQVDVLQ